MEFDMTQVVTQSDTEGEDEDSDKSTPVAHIKVLNQPSLKNKLYPVHKGDNTVGRQDLCQVSIPVRSLSKKHACIEVCGRSHFIYDMGSRNKTRRGTHYLTPEVRYELRNNDMLVFADVSCIYLVEDSARASDSGSETDPMSDSETAVFHTVAVDMYNTVGPVVNPELIEAAVASDPNSCDSAASSDILMPTQDFAVVKINQESQNQTEAIHSSKSSGNKTQNKKEPEVFKILVADSDSENEQLNVDTKDTLCFQNNGNNEDSLDMDLLTAATQAYVADSEEDDDSKSEILDMIHDYKTSDDQLALFAPDSQTDDSRKPLIINTVEPADKQVDQNGSTSPSSPFRTLFAINSPRTYSKKGGSNKSTLDASSQSIDANKDDGEKAVEEDFENTQDPNLFDLPTLVADENILRRRPSTDNETPLVSPNKDNKTGANSTNDETVTLLVTNDDKDTLPVRSEITTPQVNNREASTLSVTDDVGTGDNAANTKVTSDVAATLLVSDTIPVTSSSTKNDLDSLPVTKNDDTTNSILNDESAILVVCEEELATVEVMTEETIPIAVNVDVRDTDTIEVYHLQEEYAKQSQEGNPSMEPTLQVTEELDNIGTSEGRLETCITGTASENGPINKSNLKCITPIREKKESSPRTGRGLDDNLETLDSPVISRCALNIPYNSPKTDDEVLEATQPYMMNCLDSPSTNKGDVKCNLRFTVNNVEGSEDNVEEDTQPYILEDDETSNRNKTSVGSHSPTHWKRSGAHDISDEENSVGVSERGTCLKGVINDQQADTLLLLAESEYGNNAKMESASQNARSTAGRSSNRKVPVLKGTTTETLASSLGAEPSKMEESSLQNEDKIGRVLEEPSNLGKDKMTETSGPRERLTSEESCSSLAEIPLKEKRSTTRRNLKDSKEKNKEIAVRKVGRPRKKKMTEEKYSTENVATSVGPSHETTSNVVADEKANTEEGGIISNAKKTRRNVHFAGLSLVQDDSHESTQTCSSFSKQKIKVEEEMVGKIKIGRPSKNQTKGKNYKNITKADPEEGLSKRSRERKSKTDNVDEANTQKDLQTNESGENAEIVNQDEIKRTSSVLDESNEISSKNLTQMKLSRVRKSKSDNENNQKGNERAMLGKVPSEELPVLVKEETLAIPEKSSNPGISCSPLEKTVPAKEEEEENEAKTGPSKTTEHSEDKAEKVAGKELPGKTEDKVEEDSPPARTTRATRSKKSKDEKEENMTKKNVAEVQPRTRVSRSSKSKTAVLEDPEKIPEKDSTTEPTQNVKKGNLRGKKKTDSEEPSASNCVPRNSKRASLEEKVSEDTCTPSRPSRSVRAKKQKDQDGEADAGEVMPKEQSSRRQTKRNSVEGNKVARTTSHPKSKMSKNLPKNDEASLVNNDEDDDNDADDNDDFVAPASVEPNLERRSTSQEKALSSLYVSLEKLGSISADSLHESENIKSAKPEPRIGRKRNLSSQSSNQSSQSSGTPKRQHLNSSLSSPGTPSSRSTSTGSKPKVMFTGVTDDKLQKIVTDLGGSVVTSFDCCTHLVTDKIRRTVKFLCCLSRGIPIVSPAWLTNCKSAKMFIDHTSHIVSDPSTEKQYKFSLRNSLQQARGGPLLENYKIHVTKSVKPNVDIMKEIMDSCKAQYLRRMPNEEDENTVVISCEEDRTLCQPALDAGVPVVNAEFILTGILQYDISVNKYQIFNSSSRNKRKPTETDKGNTAAAKRRRR